MVQPHFLNVVVSINYIFTCVYVLYYIMFMNLTIHDMIHDSTTMHHGSKYRAIHDTIHTK